LRAFPYLQPVQQWTVTNVLEWMASTNLYRYVELFKLHNITGEDLVSLSDDKLKVGQTSLLFIFKNLFAGIVMI